MKESIRHYWELYDISMEKWSVISLKCLRNKGVDGGVGGGTERGGVGETVVRM